MKTKWTNQQLFDFCKKELLSPEFKQCLANDGKTCIYYNPVDNNRCIMGKTMSIEDAKIIATDNEYDKSTISIIIEKKHPAVDHLSDVDPCLAIRLQLVHDRFNETDFEIKDNLRIIAKAFDLQYEKQ